jgi:P63C domain
MAGSSRSLSNGVSAAGVLEELKRRNPRDEKGHRATKHHQWLTEDIGHPALGTAPLRHHWLYAGCYFVGPVLSDDATCLPQAEHNNVAADAGV